MVFFLPEQMWSVVGGLWSVVCGQYLFKDWFHLVFMSFYVFWMGIKFTNMYLSYMYTLLSPSIAHVHILILLSAHTHTHAHIHIYIHTHIFTHSLVTPVLHTV